MRHFFAKMRFEPNGMKLYCYRPLQEFLGSSANSMMCNLSFARAVTFLAAVRGRLTSLLCLAANSRPAHRERKDRLRTELMNSLQRGRSVDFFPGSQKDHSSLFSHDHEQLFTQGLILLENDVLFHFANRNISW